MGQSSVEIHPEETTAEAKLRISKNEPVVSLVLPVFNEGSDLVSIITSAIKRFELLFSSNFELIVVDDGSTDGTRALLDNMKKDERLRVVGYSKNSGKGNALMFGFQFAKAERVIFVDGDMDALPHDFQRHLATLDNSDIVICSKRLPGAQVNAGAKRIFLSLGFNLFVKILLPVNVSDTQVGFKAFRRKALASILPLISVKKYAFDVELLVVAKLLNLRITELPAIVMLPDSFRMGHILRMFVDLLGIAYRFHLRHWYQDNIGETKLESYRPLIKW